MCERGIKNAYLRLPHDLTPGPDPDDKYELFPLRLLVVGISDADVGVRGLARIDDLFELGEAA